MLFSAATGYALQTLAALPEDGNYHLSRDLARKLHLPAPYLAKILQSLVQAGLLESVRGPKGGFRLARPAREVTVGDVLQALEGTDVLQGCVMGPAARCSPGNPCPLHEAWSQVKTLVVMSMTQATIHDLQQFRGRSGGPGRQVSARGNGAAWRKSP